MSPPQAPPLGYVAWIESPLPEREPGDPNAGRLVQNDYIRAMALLEVWASLYQRITSIHARNPDCVVVVRMIAACPECFGDYPFATCAPNKGCEGKQIVRDYGSIAIPLQGFARFFLRGRFQRKEG